MIRTTMPLPRFARPRITLEGKPMTLKLDNLQKIETTRTQPAPAKPTATATLKHTTNVIKWYE